MASPLFVGIDLGTTNSSAAAFDGAEITVVRNGAGSSLTPSVVRVSAKGAVSVGEKARRFLDTDADNTRTGFKRLLGTDTSLRFPRQRPIAVARGALRRVLKSIAHDCEVQLGVRPTAAVITVPALFEIPQTRATSAAAKLAGFDRVELLQEPVASALAAGFKSGSEGTWLVYDLGGGTFDVSLLSGKDGLLRVVGHDGDNFLGGRDFDTAIVQLGRRTPRGRWHRRRLQKSRASTVFASPRRSRRRSEDRAWSPKRRRAHRRGPILLGDRRSRSSLPLSEVDP